MRISNTLGIGVAWGGVDTGVKLDTPGIQKAEKDLWEQAWVDVGSDLC
jgi:hypothetical protein